MKSLFYTILIIGGAFCAYDYFLAPPGQKIVFKSLNPPKKPKVVASAPQPEEEKKEMSAPAPVVETPKAPAVETAKPKVAEAPKPAAPSGPKVETIEELTGNWLLIPASAFTPPREVKLKQDAMFKMSVGASKVAAGGIAYAVGSQNGVLTLAPTATSPARAQLPIDGTDLKERLNELYEKWKVVRLAELKANAAKKQQMMASQPPPSAPSSGEVEADGKPVRGSDGKYPLLVASIKRGQVTEIHLENITNWREAQPATIQGKKGWAVQVSCDVKTIFGLQPVEVQALILDGRVTGWYYTGSGEEVP